MEYKSTRNSSIRKTASEAIYQGLSSEGGLFVPTSFPSVVDNFEAMSKMSYNELAQFVFSQYLADFTNDEIKLCVENAYTNEKFSGDEPVKIVDLSCNRHVLELWHGPTCAFKDMALQILPHFLTVSMKKQGQGGKVVILVATSGDTGKAALEGFRDVDGTEIIVFYPENGVSPLQEKQMNTQEGKNVAVCAIKGNFDDAQTAVKQVFTNPDVKEWLSERNSTFSSANSINFGRLLPQLVYYFYAYFDLYNKGVVKTFDEKVNIVVPTGNFGNILAAYFAYKMGLPVNRFICASNENNVLTDFINTGIYDKNREFYTTASPSMDILISSNLERLLYLLCGEDSEEVCRLMKSLNDEGKYEIDSSVKKELRRLFYGDFATDEETAETIENILCEEGYLCDTHTAVAMNVYEKYVNDTGDKTPTVIASTASPYKFVDAVLSAVSTETAQDEFGKIALLEKLSHTEAQPQIKELKGKQARFSDVIDKAEIESYAKEKIEGVNG